MEQPVYRPCGIAAFYKAHFRPSLRHPLLDHAKIDAAFACPDDSGQNVFPSKPIVELPARLPALAPLNKRSAQPESIAQAPFRRRQTRRRDVLAKCPTSIKQLMAARDSPPNRIMILHLQIHGLCPFPLVNQILVDVPFSTPRPITHLPVD